MWNNLICIKLGTQFIFYEIKISGNQELLWLYLNNVCFIR